MLKKTRTFLPLTLLVLSCWLPLEATAENIAHPCIQTPTPTCLVATALTVWPTLDHADPGVQQLGSQLAYEAQQFNLPFEFADPDQQTRTRLEKEDLFIEELEAHHWQKSENLGKSLPEPFQDFLQAPAAALYLESLTLALRDNDADQLKKSYYASLLTLTAESRTQRMIAVAQHEILGGQAEKGLATLRNTDINDFSASEFVLARRITEFLAARSAELFLAPDKYTLRCNNPEQLPSAIQFYLESQAIQTALHSRDFPDTRSRIELLLLLARLYKNSESCPLLVFWLSKQAIQLSVADGAPKPQQLLSQIQLARTLRRYFEPDT